MDDEGFEEPELGGGGLATGGVGGGWGGLTCQAKGRFLRLRRAKRIARSFQMLGRWVRPRRLRRTRTLEESAIAAAAVGGFME